MKSEGQLHDLAASVADGSQVDWQAAETGAGKDARRLVRHLRLVADLAELYRSLPEAPRHAIDGVRRRRDARQSRPAKRAARGSRGGAHRAGLVPRARRGPRGGSRARDIRAQNVMRESGGPDRADGLRHRRGHTARRPRRASSGRYPPFALSSARSSLFRRRGTPVRGRWSRRSATRSPRPALLRISR